MTIALTIGQAAEIMQVSPSYVRSMIDRGDIQAARLGSSRNAPVRVLPSEVARVLGLER
jgi:excisionase family DNA binding protein